MPYALASFPFHLSTRLDVVFLGVLLGAIAAAVYNVAYRVIFLLTFVPQLAAFALFPLASQLYANKQMSEFKALYHGSLGVIVLTGLPLAAVVWLIAPDLIYLAFGANFADSASILRMLTGLLFFTWLSRIMEIFLMSCDRLVFRTQNLWAAAAMNLLGNLVLIPPFGLTGAAGATLISEALLVVLHAARLRPVLGWPRVASHLAISSIGVAVFVVPTVILSSLSLIILIPVSVLIYSGALASYELKSKVVEKAFSGKSEDVPFQPER